MRNVDHTPIINLFGGIRALAKGLKHRNASTVQGWSERKFIPGRRQQELLDLARANGIRLSPDDFFTTKRAPLRAVGNGRTGKGAAVSNRNRSCQ